MLFKLARILLIICLLEVAYCVITICRLCWPWPPLALAGLIAWSRMHAPMQLFAHGSARWADEDDLRRAGMIGGSKGLSIGRMGDSTDDGWVKNILSVLDSNVKSEKAVTKCLYGWTGKVPGEIVRLSTSVHSIICGPTGTGKGASFIIPWLKEVDESAVVLDYKGENARISAQHRERVFGHRVVLLDPYRVVTSQPDRFNPLTTIRRDSYLMIDDCRDLAQQLVVRSIDEREPHWSDSAEAWISAAIAATVQFAEPQNHSLQTIRDVLSNPNKLPKLIELLCSGEGMLPRLGSQLAFYRDKELASTLTTTNRHLRFLDSDAIASNTADSSFDPYQLRNGKMTIYCILPPEHLRAQSGLIRMWIGTLNRVVIQQGLQRGHS